MAAELLFYHNQIQASSAIIEMKIWRVRQSVPPASHGLKYSLFYGFPGHRIVGFDSERGKGDHMHISGEEFPYTFTTVDQLVSDFLAEVRKAGGGGS
jgi:Family of unknown function (DUF6516)